MKKMLNTLFITTAESYLTLEGENIVVKQGEASVARFPFHTLQEIISFSYAGASPALMGACAKRNIGLSFCTPSGRFLARTLGETTGNVLLRREQYRIADNLDHSCAIARNFIFGKVHNSRWRLERTLRDHKIRVNHEKISHTSQMLKKTLPVLRETTNLDQLRGYEGETAAMYFSVMDDLVLNNKDVFAFRGRNRRPPLDPINAMLSFSYTLLASHCASALESVGLDSYVGFLHRDRPGRQSLALDLMEELRAPFADSFVLSLINKKQLSGSDFETRESGAVRFTEDGRRLFLKKWQERKMEKIKHPFLNETVEWGLVPYTQALLLARYLRGDMEEYPAFLWK